jgi:hypothetical protein
MFHAAKRLLQLARPRIAGAAPDENAVRSGHDRNAGARRRRRRAAVSRQTRARHRAVSGKRITCIGTTASAIIVHPSLPAATVAEFIAHARGNPAS